MGDSQLLVVEERGMGRRKRPVEKSRSVRRLLVPAVIGLAIVVGAVSLILLPRGDSTSNAAQYQGGPRLAVDKDLIDFGNVPYRKVVKASFRLRNVGDKPLTLPANPPLETVEGC
jgi:hypothetical protein